jgi:hypothetical protein
MNKVKETRRANQDEIMKAILDLIEEKREVLDGGDVRYVLDRIREQTFKGGICRLRNNKNRTYYRY